jgi:acyl-CoA oxidase
MRKDAPPLSIYTPGVLSLLPLFYIGWTDSLLSPSEVKFVRKKVEEFQFLTKEDKSTLLKWWDPASPPSHHLFKEWITILQKAVKEFPENSRQSFAELGLKMAQKSATQSELIQWQSAQTRDALNELENAMGAVNADSFKNIFTKSQIKKQKGIASFDINKMQKLLDDDYPEIKKLMRTLLSDPVFNHPNLRNKEDYRSKTLEWCHLLAEQGVGILAYPEAQGGKGDMGKYIAIFEMLGYHDLSLTIKFGVQFGLFGGSVLWLGTKKHHEKYLEKIGKLQLPGCYAMTETGHGSDVRNLETTATYDAKSAEFIIHSPNEESSGKEFIGNALHGKMATVFAQLIVKGENHGIHALLVPLRDDSGNLLPGVRIEDCGYKLGLNGVDNGKIWFDKVRVSRENLLNRFGDVDEKGNYNSPIENPAKRFFTMLGTLVGGRVSVPRAGLSAAKSALTIAIKYALKRRQFAPKDGEPETLLLDYPSHQRRLMPLLAKAYALDFALTDLAKKYVNSNENNIREIETLAAGLKSYATWYTTKTIQECREACGGKGYLTENRFADMKADTDIFTTFEGDNTVLMQLVAKALLSDFKQEFHDEGFRAIIRLLVSQVTSSVTELNPIITRRTDVDHLLDREFQLNTFYYHERKLLVSVSQRMRDMLGKGIPAHDAFLRCQTHLLMLAEAFVEHFVLKQFIQAINACKDDGVKNMLKKLCDLYALSTIETHKGWYLEQDYFQGVKTKAIRKLVDKLCKDVRIEADALVDAFAIPKQCLAAPIAF